MDTQDAQDDPDATEQPQPPVTRCYRHPERECYVRCTRCDRYICPDCMREAPVGHQCVECVREGSGTVREPRTAFGGRIGGAPVATWVLIGVNVLAYLLELASPGVLDRLENLGTGLRGPDGGTYLAVGGPYPGFQAVGVAHGEWYRLITSTFLHLLPTQGILGITHILFNMYWLWLLGRIMEQQLGRARFVALYLLSALGGSVLVYLLAPTESTVGASGAIFGLAAGYYVTARRLRHDPAAANRLIITFLIWMVISAGMASWQGHLGGLLTGGAVTLAFAFAPRNRRTPVQAASAVLVLAVLVALVLLKTRQLTGAA
ncbi:rhomboid family intramembrane serine protease [Streptomyces sp. NPDC092296]|uniref:rhomboid family intramembrane serine protease n=1 Tax=Streptomyces sp. NPDC092296 TaxID=3366012 RepID=UPI003828E1AF